MCFGRAPGPAMYISFKRSYAFSYISIPPQKVPALNNFIKHNLVSVIQHFVKV